MREPSQGGVFAFDEINDNKKFYYPVSFSKFALMPIAMDRSSLALSELGSYAVAELSNAYFVLKGSKNLNIDSFYFCVYGI